MRVTKEQQSSQNAAGTQAAGVEANLPKPPPSGTEQKQSNDNTQKREELTNYEVSSKSIQTTSAGFIVQNLSVAVLINRAALAASLKDKNTPEAMAAQVKEIEALVSSAAGLDAKRGDIVKIEVVDFVDSSRDLEPAPGPSILEIVARQLGSFVNAGAIVLVAAMLIWFGVRPGMRMLLVAPAPLEAASEELAEMAFPTMGESLMLGNEPERDEFLEALTARRESGPERKMLKLVDFDEGQAATILKQWIRNGADA